LPFLSLSLSRPDDNNESILEKTMDPQPLLSFFPFILSIHNRRTFPQNFGRFFFILFSRVALSVVVLPFV
jgi:hypothetical protein